MVYTSIRREEQRIKLLHPQRRTENKLAGLEREAEGQQAKASLTHWSITSRSSRGTGHCLRFRAGIFLLSPH
jgi:hypothetical protein